MRKILFFSFVITLAFMAGCQTPPEDGRFVMSDDRTFSVWMSQSMAERNFDVTDHRHPNHWR